MEEFILDTILNHIDREGLAKETRVHYGGSHTNDRGAVINYCDLFVLPKDIDITGEITEDDLIRAQNFMLSLKPKLNTELNFDGMKFNTGGPLVTGTDYSKLRNEIGYKKYNFQYDLKRCTLGALMFLQKVGTVDQAFVETKFDVDAARTGKELGSNLTSTKRSYMLIQEICLRPVPSVAYFEFSKNYPVSEYVSTQGFEKDIQEIRKYQEEMGRIYLRK